MNDPAASSGVSGFSRNLSAASGGEWTRRSFKPAVATANPLLRIDPENKEALAFLTRVRNQLGALEPN